MLSPDRIPDLDAARPARPPTMTSCAAPSRSSPSTGATSPRSRRSRTPPASPPTELHHLFRRWAGTHAQGVPAGDHARPCARGCCAIPRACSTPPSRSACPDRAGCTTCSSPTRRCRRANGRPAATGLTICLRLPPLAVRHRAGHGDRARARRPRLRRCRRGDGGARRHAQPLAEGALCRGQRAHRAAGAPHLRSRRCGAPTGRCASC